MDVAGERPGAAGLAGAGEAVPGFYVALELVGDGQCCRPGLPYAPLTQAVVRATATGAALAAVTAPRPYGTFTGVTAAADNRTFVLAAQKTAQLPLTTPPATRFFLLCIDPADRVPAGREPLTPLPVPEQPPGRAVSGLALSPDAARLTVTAGRLTAPALRIFCLATGHERVWDGPVVFGYGPGAASGSLSWDAAGQTLALITSGTGQDSGVRLLDTTAPSSRLPDSSRLVPPSPPRGPENRSGNYWRQVMISADGQAIIGVLQLDGRLGSADRVTQKLVTFSPAPASSCTRSTTYPSTAAISTSCGPARLPGC